MLELSPGHRKCARSLNGRLLLASSSVAALLIGGGAPAFAACYTGPFTGGYSNGGATACITVNNTSFTGTLGNTGTISPGPTGIAVVNHSTITGQISDSGTIIASGRGILIDNTSIISGANTGIFVGGPTFTGGISNAGTIAAGVRGTGIRVNKATTFSGGITNSGTITAVSDGISASAVSTFSNGIANSGTIVASASGIGIGLMTSFSGGVSNRGTISAGSDGIYVSNVVQFGKASIAGGITNSGTITSGGDAIYLSNVTSFYGGITNGGTLFGSAGIVVANGSTFAGGIVNSGTISASAGNGILVTAVTQFGTTSVGGGITNSGVISATAGAGINLSILTTFAGGISNGGAILAGATGISIGSVTTFLGSVSNSGTISAAALGINIASVSVFSQGITNSGTIIAGGEGIGLNNVTIFGSSLSGGITNTGTISSSGGGGIAAGGSSIFSGNISNSGTITAAYTGIAAAITTTFTGGIFNSGTISASNGLLALGITNFMNGISNSGHIAASNVGIYLLGVSTFMGGISNSGTIAMGSLGAGIVVGATAFYGNVSNSGMIIGGRTGIYICDCATFAGGAIVNTGTISGTTAAIDASHATSPITIEQISGLIAGNIKLSANADQLDISGGTIVGNIVGQGSSDTINFALGAGSFTYGAADGFSAINQVNVFSGTVVLDGTNAATNVAVNGGTLVIGDLSNPAAMLQASVVTVSGGTLAGDGTIDPGGTVVTINSGGTLAPGTPGGLGTLTIAGDLVFNAGSIYAIQIALGAGNNSKTAVTGASGTANLGGNGTVVVTPQLGRYSGAIYQILTTTAGLSGSFAGVTVSGDFSGSATLDYLTNPGDVDLDVSGSSLLATPSGANTNQQNVVTGINNGIMQGPANMPLPAQFQSVAGLSGSALLNDLTALSGEAATGAAVSAFQITTEFLNLMLDPAAGGGGGGGGGGSGGGATGFAPEQDTSLPADVALAYAKALKAPQPDASPQNFDQRWSAWGAAFGGSNSTNGDAAVGSHDTTTGTYGFAAGMDYRLTPQTLVGFALAGGGTNWSLAQGLGSGRSDTFQAGLYAKTHAGPAYLSGALAFANHWFTTSRIALGDDLTARFSGQSYAARGEAGYRFAVLPMVGVTPYGALQVQDFHTPSYSEADLTGGGFGLSHSATSATDTRSELGARVDDLTVVNGMPLVLRGRLAWAHDWVSNAALGAAFEALPGSSFTVNGAAVPANSALATAAAELHVNAAWTLSAKFDGEFASSARTYAGTGTLRYSW